jgi:hypothetical protein
MNLRNQVVWMNHSSGVVQFAEHESKTYFQNGEDGVLRWIFENIETVKSPPYFVEFGVQTGDECNTRSLRNHMGWLG